jgi:hypothetical protein
MKRAKKTAGRDLIRLIPCLSENQILDLNEMLCVKGGDGDGTPIILPPPPIKV